MRALLKSIISASSAGATAYTQFRIDITAQETSGTRFTIHELEFLVNGADVSTPSSTVAVSAYYPGFGGEKAIDNNSGTFWGIYSPTFPVFIVVTPASSPVAVDSISMRAEKDMPSNSPKNFTVRGSNDSGSTWTLIKTFTNVTGWTPDEVKTFSLI